MLGDGSILPQTLTGKIPGSGMSDPSQMLTDASAANDPAYSDDGNLAQGIWYEFCRARTERLQRDYEWYVSWQWYNGDVGVLLDRSSGSGQIYRVRSRRPRKTRNLPLNLIGHSIDLLCAKQMRARPTFDATAGSRARMADRLAAREVRDLVRFLWDKNELTAERRKLFLDRNITGNAFAKVWWNAAMAPFRTNMQPCPTCNIPGIAGAQPGRQPPPPEVVQMSQALQSQGMPAPPIPDYGPCPTCGPSQTPGMVNQGRTCLGDTAVTVVSPWEVWPVAGAKSIEDGCFQAYKVTKEYASAMFNLPIADIRSSNQLDKGESHFAQLAKRYRLSDQDEDAVWIVQKWMPPLPKTETPRVTILCGDKLVWPAPGSPDVQQGWTTQGVPPIGRVPFFHFRLRPAAEQMWSTGITIDMISANDFVNRTRASFHRHQQTMAFTKWLVEEGGVDQDQLTAEEGEVVTYRSVNPPRQSDVSPMPQFYVNVFQMEMDFIPKIAGLQDIDQGKAPPNIEAFQALHFLAEQSETVHGPIYLEDERQWRQIAWAVVRTSIFFYQPSDQRLLRIGGSAVEVKALLNADISDSVVIRCETGSALAHSPALRQEMVFRALEAGLVTPQNIMARGLLDFGTMLGEDEDDHRAQEAMAESENEAIAQGQPHFLLTAAHDHLVHYEVHRRAALEAQAEGNFQLALEYDMACQQHMQLAFPQVPPAPGRGASAKGPTNGQRPFDSGGVQSQFSPPPAGG